MIHLITACPPVDPRDAMLPYAMGFIACLVLISAFMVYGWFKYERPGRD